MMVLVQSGLMREGMAFYSSAKDSYLSSSASDQNNSAQKANFWGYFTKQE